MRILLVEDDDRVAAALRTSLVRHGFEVTRAATGEEAFAEVRQRSRPDLVLLDMGLPDVDGIEVCRQLRAGNDLPIIIVTARGEEGARVAGLRAGADDYVVKPFSISELVARIEAVLRRYRRADTPDTMDIGDVRIDLGQRSVHVDGRPIALTRKEFDLIAALARRGGAVAERQQLLAEVWNTTWRGTSKTLDVHITTLRSKLGRPHLIETVRGVGYRLATSSTMEK